MLNQILWVVEKRIKCVRTAQLLKNTLKNTGQFIDRALQKKKMEATKDKVLYQEKFQI